MDQEDGGCQHPQQRHCSFQRGEGTLSEYNDRAEELSDTQRRMAAVGTPSSVTASPETQRRREGTLSHYSDRAKELSDTPKAGEGEW